MLAQTTGILNAKSPSGIMTTAAGAKGQFPEKSEILRSPTAPEIRGYSGRSSRRPQNFKYLWLGFAATWRLPFTETQHQPENPLKNSLVCWALSKGHSELTPLRFGPVTWLARVTVPTAPSKAPVNRCTLHADLSASWFGLVSEAPAQGDVKEATQAGSDTLGAGRTVMLSIQVTAPSGHSSVGLSQGHGLGGWA